MQFMLAIYEDEAIYGDENSQAWQDIIAAHTKLGEELEAAGVIRGGAGLEPSHTATTVENNKGKFTVHDGPFADTKEQLGGFYIIDVPDLDTAIAWAKKIPLFAGGKVEIRPTLVMPE